MASGGRGRVTIPFQWEQNFGGEKMTWYRGTSRRRQRSRRWWWISLLGFALLVVARCFFLMPPSFACSFSHVAPQDGRLRVYSLRHAGASFFPVPWHLILGNRSMQWEKSGLILPQKSAIVNSIGKRRGDWGMAVLYSISCFFRSRGKGDGFVYAGCGCDPGVHADVGGGPRLFYHRHYLSLRGTAPPLSRQGAARLILSSVRLLLQTACDFHWSSCQFSSLNRFELSCDVCHLDHLSVFEA